MLIGKHYHTIEDTGRASLPKAFRKHADSWIVTRGIDGELLLYTPTHFEAQLQALTQNIVSKKSTRDAIRLLTNEAQEVESDNQGRILIPAYLTQYAKLTKNIVIVGSLDHLEIWDRDTYHTYTDNIESQANQIAQEAAQ